LEAIMNLADGLALLALSVESLRELSGPHPGPAPVARFHPRDVVA
jgi:hypothetical protein